MSGFGQYPPLGGAGTIANPLTPGGGQQEIIGDLLVTGDIEITGSVTGDLDITGTLTVPTIITSAIYEAAAGNTAGLEFGAGAGGEGTWNLFTDLCGIEAADSGLMNISAFADIQLFADGAIRGVFSDQGLVVKQGLAVSGVTAIQTADYVATAADIVVLVDVNTTGDVAVTLPAASAAKGQILTVKATATHASRDINVNRAGADTIVTMAATGATTLQLSPVATFSCATLVSDGTSKWYVVALTA